MQDGLETKLEDKTRTAYFCMEVGIETDIPTYSGGLGVLAGDTLKSCADIGIPMVGVSLLWSSGYFYQEIDPFGRQVDFPIYWDPKDKECLKPIEKIVEIEIFDRKVKVGAWKYDVKGMKSDVPIIFLDTNIEGNQPQDKLITSKLYRGDQRQRIIQEIVLGIGGVKMLRALGFNNIKTFHMNEGHSAFLTLELLAENGYSINDVKGMSTFTTHAPVQAAFDCFSYQEVESIMGKYLPIGIKKLAGNDYLNMAMLAFNMSRYVNGVSRKHGEVSSNIFNQKVDYITNGVHSQTWTSPEFAALFDVYFPKWREDPEVLKEALKIDPKRAWAAHRGAKSRLINYINKNTKTQLNENLLTIGFARRFAPYKRADLIFRDIERLAAIGKGKLQLVYSGKSHPDHEEGKELIRKIIDYSNQLLEKKIRVVFLENYSMELGKLMTGGVDLWLNTPKRPQEASGTSGMKAAHNGVLNFSVLDGWVPEGFEMDPLAGWPIGPEPKEVNLVNYDESLDHDDLMNKLEKEIIPMYYNKKDEWMAKMPHANFLAWYFNSHRMVKEYVTKAGW